MHISCEQDVEYDVHRNTYNIKAKRTVKCQILSSLFSIAYFLFFNVYVSAESKIFIFISNNQQLEKIQIEYIELLYIYHLYDSRYF